MTSRYAAERDAPAGSASLPRTPRRVQLRRTKGWRKPDSAVVVARPSRWGNPHVVTREPGTRYGDIVCPPWWKVITDPERQYYMIRTSEPEARQLAVDEYRRDLERQRDLDLSALVGRDLACWCPLDQPCHADVLLELANQERS